MFIIDKRIAAASALEKISNIINLKIFNRKSLLERVEDPAIFESYLKFLKELDFLKEFKKIYSNEQILNK